MSEQKEPYGKQNQDNYTATTRNYNGTTIRVTVSQDEVVITKHTEEHPIAMMVMTRDQARELAQIVISGLRQGELPLPDWARE